MNETSLKYLSIFEFISYKSFLKDFLKLNKSYRGLSKKMSDAAKCQPSYFSQVMNTKVQLTPDQGFGISNFLQLSEGESNYLMMLVDLERAGTPEYRKHLLDKIKGAQKKQQQIGSQLNRNNPNNNQFLATYYSHWAYCYLHILTSIPEFQHIENIVAKMSMPVERVLIYLSELESANLVIKSSGLWKHSGREWHLDSNSPFINLHHFNWRSQAMASTHLPQEESSHFSAVYSISKADFPILKNQFLAFLKEFNATCAKSGTEEIVVLCCDLFSK